MQLAFASATVITQADAKSTISLKRANPDATMHVPTYGGRIADDAKPLSKMQVLAHVGLTRKYAHGHIQSSRRR